MTIVEHRKHLQKLKKLIENSDWRPPAGLSAKAQKLWQSVVPLRARSAENLLSLEVALQAFDRLQVIDAELKNGDLVKTAKSGARHAHPLLGVERGLRRDFLKHWTALDLHYRSSMDRPSWAEIQGPGSVDYGTDYLE